VISRRRSVDTSLASEATNSDVPPYRTHHPKSASGVMADPWQRQTDATSSYQNNQGEAAYATAPTHQRAHSYEAMVQPRQGYPSLLQIVDDRLLSPGSVEHAPQPSPASSLEIPSRRLIMPELPQHARARTWAVTGRDQFGRLYTSMIDSRDARSPVEHPTSPSPSDAASREGASPTSEADSTGERVVASGSPDRQSIQVREYIVDIVTNTYEDVVCVYF